MIKNRKIYIILPVYNEGISIYNLLKNFEEFLIQCPMEHKIIIINDCSTDDTEKFIFEAQNEITALNIQYQKHEINGGLGKAMSSGFNTLESYNDNDAIVIMDADDTHSPFLIREMLHKINEGADLVIASRYCEQSRITGLSKLRIFLSKGANLLYSIVWNLSGVKDYTCNFRAYKGTVIKAAQNKYKDKLIVEQSFASAAELLKKIFLASPNLVAVEVPMILNYGNKKEKSNMNITNNILQTLYILFKKN